MRVVIIIIIIICFVGGETFLQMKKKIVAINYDILIVNNINNERFFLIFLVQAMKQKLINMEKP
jgi:hypothetical protein